MSKLEDSTRAESASVRCRWLWFFYIESNIFACHWLLPCVYSLPSKANMQALIRAMPNCRIVRIDKMINVLVVVGGLILVVSIVPPLMK